MTHSLNEIESLARKAARGAGYSWGLAEEAGKSVRFLCAAGLPGAEALAGWLTKNDGCEYRAHCPECSGDDWRAPGGVLCPLITGAALCDRAAMLTPGDTIILGPTAYPVLLIPAVASASDLSGAGLTLAWPGVTVARTGRETWLNADPSALNTPRVEQLTLTVADTRAGSRLRRGYRGCLPEGPADILNRFAHRTYAPETEESRLAGAGAGLTDND